MQTAEQSAGPSQFWPRENDEIEKRKKLEREKGFEPSTLALARRCSTTELFPLKEVYEEGPDFTQQVEGCQAT
jgi:hypothetical protein